MDVITEIKKPAPALPRRMSAPKIEDTKPSRLIEAFWWLVFIVPVGFLYWTTQSLLYVGILVGVRIVIMFIPKFRKQPEPNPTSKKETPLLIAPAESVNTNYNPLTPYKEELVSEWKGLLKMLRIYDHDKENKYLSDYRKLRGWDK